MMMILMTILITTSSYITAAKNHLRMLKML